MHEPRDGPAPRPAVVTLLPLWLLLLPLLVLVQVHG